MKIFACLDQISPLEPMSEAGYTMVGQAEEPNNELAPPGSQEGASKVRFTFRVQKPKTTTLQTDTLTADKV